MKSSVVGCWRVASVVTLAVLGCSVFGQAGQATPKDGGKARKIGNGLTAQELVAQMTFEEKLEEINLGKAGMRASQPNKRLNIPPTRAINGPRGPGDKVPTNVNYPVALGMAATWDERLMEVVGEEWGKAMLETQRNHLFGPGVNLCRHPLAGRNAEYQGEDPFHAGKMVAAQTRGIQKTGNVATIKHFAGNDFECGRNLVDVRVPERVLREQVLRPFQMSVEEGGALEVMSSYNRLSWSASSRGKRPATALAMCSTVM